MIKLVITFLSYILIFFNTNLLSDEKNDELKVGLLVPFTGEYKNLGNSLLLSTQLALSEIGDNRIVIIPKNRIPIYSSLIILFLAKAASSIAPGAFAL